MEGTSWNKHEGAEEEISLEKAHKFLEDFEGYTRESLELIVLLKELCRNAASKGIVLDKDSIETLKKIGYGEHDTASIDLERDLLNLKHFFAVNGVEASKENVITE